MHVSLFKDMHCMQGIVQRGRHDSSQDDVAHGDPLAHTPQAAIAPRRAAHMPYGVDRNQDDVVCAI